MEEKTEKMDLETEEKKELVLEKQGKIEEVQGEKETGGQEEAVTTPENFTAEKENSLLQKIEELTKLLQEKEEEFQKEHDRWLRAVAELENYKKRVSREKSEILKFGNESLIRELLPVIDNLELSLEHARNASNLEAIIQGIELVRKEFLQKLEKFGLRVISARGEKFDPYKHEATAKVETSDHPEDTVIEEFQKGYMIHDRLLRPARVGIAKPPEN